jgi:crotonobetainyl-CoA:carnitine CoA-transferase CaiB-like acyl-CoA transferase
MTEKPLAGIRVIDFCVVWAGPFATMQLGDLGAEIIKVENPFVYQPMTRGSMAHPPQALLERTAAVAGGMPGGVVGDKPWNYSPSFVSLFRNKKSVTMNILTPEGMDLLKRLVAVSDVVCENNAAGTMEKLGITYDWLREANPNIIFVRMPAYGSSGPYYNARALGVHLEGVMGHTLLRGYDDTDPSATTAIYSGDYLAGAQGAFAVMAALWRREKTGEGQLIEIAQAENAAAMFAQAIMDYSLNGNIQGAIGNRDIFGRYPCGVYPAKSPGTAETMEDHWIAIHIETDAQWRAFGEAIGKPEWATDPRFATNDGRAAHYKEIDQHIAEYTKDQDDYELMHLLQGAGIAAAPVLEASRAFDEPQLRARDFFRRMAFEGAEQGYEFMGPLWQFSETPVEFSPPVTFGRDNEYVYKQVLGVSNDEYDRYREMGFIATEYDASVP